MAKLINIEGIGEVYAAKLAEVGLTTTGQLLKAGATPKGREDLVASTGIAKERVLDWVNRADLFRIKGIGEEYSDLLELAGVDTVPELAQRNPENLHAKMAEVNAEKKAVRVLPSLNKVKDWVAQAKELPRAVSY